MNFTGVPLMLSSSDSLFGFSYLPANTGKESLLVIGSNSINRWLSIATKVFWRRPMHFAGVQLMLISSDPVFVYLYLPANTGKHN